MTADAARRREIEGEEARQGHQQEEQQEMELGGQVETGLRKNMISH